MTASDIRGLPVAQQDPTTAGLLPPSIQQTEIQPSQAGIPGIFTQQYFHSLPISYLADCILYCMYCLHFQHHFHKRWLLMNRWKARIGSYNTFHGNYLW